MKFNLPHIASLDLNQYINQLGDNIHGCEVGVWEGDNLCHMLESCPNIKNIIGIDPYTPYDDYAGSMVAEQFDGVRQKLFSNIASVDSTDRVTFLETTSLDGSTQIEDGVLDFVFIDANHTYQHAYEDFNLFYSKVKSGGIFAGHDFSIPGVNQALVQFLNERGVENGRVSLLRNDSWFFYKD